MSPDNEGVELIPPEVDEQITITVLQLSDDPPVYVEDRLNVNRNIHVEAPVDQHLCDICGHMLLIRTLAAAHKYFALHRQFNYPHSRLVRSPWRHGPVRKPRAHILLSDTLHRPCLQSRWQSALHLVQFVHINATG